jgi:hypothetical protein
MSKTVGAVLAICMICQPVFAADIGVGATGRHIIEVAINPPNSREFIINGSRYASKGDSCRRWEAGDRIDLIRGDWHGFCVSSIFHNYTRRSTCEMWCGYAAFHW